MYILERKTMYIVPEAMTKNRTFQSYRWKQVCMCSDRSVLEEALKKQSRPKDWRITETAEEAEEALRGGRADDFGTSNRAPRNFFARP